jgi:hypothetical protein
MLQSCLDHLTANFCSPHVEFDNRTGLVGSALKESPSRWQVKIIICTTHGQHALHHVLLPSEAEHRATNVPPQHLGFACHIEMARLIDEYDYFCYLEDDILIADPMFFDKQLWFNARFKDECMLQPNRYELFKDRYKIYVDGPLPEGVIRPHLVGKNNTTLEAQVLEGKCRFIRSTNPLSGCFFLSAEQFRHWARSAIFDDRDSSLLSPLESAQILGPLKLFRIYKPARENADFLEVIHADARLTKAPTPNAILNRKFAAC